MLNLWSWRAAWHIALIFSLVSPGVSGATTPIHIPRPITEAQSSTFLRTVETIPPSPTDLTYAKVVTLPAFLPYTLGAAVDVQSDQLDGDTLPVQITLTAAEMPADPDSQALARIFYYDEAATQWQKLPTQRAFGGAAWQLSADGPAPGIYAAALSSTPDYGDYQQPWQPTISQAQVDTFTGAVQWSYPLDIPGGRNGPALQLALTYNSGVVDDLRGTQNPQAAWVGMGWNLDVGYIAREIELDDNYVPRCIDEYYFVLNGVSSKLISTGGNQYRTEDERFWRIERREGVSNRGGDDWLVTTPDGVEYRFGYQDETAGGDSRESAWWMVTSGCDGSPEFRYTNWRWNLDQVADRHGNVVRIDYHRETNDFVFLRPGHAHIYSDGRWCDGAYECVCQVYGLPYYCHDYMAGDDHPSGYARGGSLEQITYSWLGATHKVFFDLTTRDDYPESFDSHTQTQLWQTFWSKQRLQTVEVRSVDQGQVARRYELTLNDADGLLLESVQEIAAGGTRLPEMTFGYQWLPGYTGTCTAGDEENGHKFWLGSIANGYGGGTSFNYTAPSGPWFQNGQTMGPSEDGKCWYRYRVREVKVNAGVGEPDQRTVYEYRYSENDNPHAGTWVGDEFRGHPRVRVKQRDASGAVASYQDHYFHQGDGGESAACDASVSDRDGMEGRAYMSASYDAGGQELARTATAHLYRDLGGGRRFVSTAAVCAYPDGASGPHSKTEYVYDDYGNVTRETRHGNTTQNGDEVVVEREYVYNLGQWLLRTPWRESVKAGNGALQRQTRYAYDEQAVGQPPIKGLVTRVERGRADWGWVTTQTGYDDWGNAEVVTDALGHATQIEYDATHQRPVRVTNSLGYETETQWDMRLGVPEIITDANGAATHLEYDDFGRVIAVMPPGDTFPALKYTYPPSGTLAAPFVITTETRVDPYLGVPQYQTSWTVHDGLGRVIQTQSEAENGWLTLSSMAYDELGRPVTASLPYTTTASGGAYHPPDWAVRPKTITTYDDLGRVIQVQAADGSLTRKRYQAWSELALDAEGHQTVYENDGLGRLTQVREYYGDYPSPDWNAPNPAITRYEHDAQGHLTRVQDALGHVTRLGYDPLGRKEWMDDPSMGYWTYGYDDAGNLVTQTDAENQTLTFDYDVLNRLTRKTHAGATLAEYGYDWGAWGIGRRTAMTATSGATAWQYDVQGRVLVETKTIDGAGTFVTAWAYDAAGRAITTTYPTGEAVRTTYNLRGLPTSVTGSDEYLTGADYDASGQPLLQAWGNTRQTSYAYEPDTLRLQSLRVSGGLLDLGYGYDDVGNILSITDGSNAGQVQTFSYDARDRLLTAQTNAVGQGQYAETYAYDLMGNIITRTMGGEEIVYTYGQRYGLVLPGPTSPVTGAHQIYLPLVARNHDPQHIGQPFAVVATSAGFRAGYDHNGNMLARVEISGTERVTYTQAWDVENRLNIVTNTVTGEVTRFVYDGDGSRVLRERPDGGITAYLGAVEVTLTGTQRLTKTYYFAGGQRIAMREGVTVTYLHRDHLGSASLATDESGGLVSEMRYTPNGVTRSGDMPTAQRFTDQRWESGLGLYDYGARFYSPSLGRFISADTIIPESSRALQFNRYTYAANNPVRHADPTGHCITPFCIGEAALVVTGLVLLTGCNAQPPSAPPRSPTPTSLPAPATATATASPPTSTPTRLPTHTPFPTLTPTPLPGTAYTEQELNTAALIVAKEVGMGEFFRGTEEEVTNASTYVAWSMRNRIEIGDPCGAGCPYNPDYPLRASSYGETFQAYDPYRLRLLPETIDPIVLELVRAVWDLPAGTPNPIMGADYILSRAYYKLYEDSIDVEPVDHYFWTPKGGTEQGIYFFTEWPVVITP